MTSAPLCERCVHREETYVFVLCKHDGSRYKIAEEEEHHTCTHMRGRGACGPNGLMFSPIPPSKSA